MKKRIKIRKFSRKRDQRRALIKSLCRNLFLKEKIKTTEARAKEMKKYAEKFINKAKVDNFNTYRYLSRYFDKKTVQKLIKEIAPKYKERNGGYLRIYKLLPRKSDGAKMAIVELIS
jgi:large subunit ribosomal protein L17